MAKIPVQTKLLLEDVPEEHREWMSRIIIPINQFISAQVAAMTNDLTFTENIRAQIKDVTFINNAASFPLKFRSTLKTVPQYVLKLKVVDISETPVDLTSAIDIPDWEFTQEQEVQINTITGLTASQKYKLTVLVL
jgi:hypothetical protein